VAVWHDGAILLVRNSYVSYFNLPGGYVRRTETARQAALRELAEEVGVSGVDDLLALALDVTHEWEGRRDHVEIFAVELSQPPHIEVDNREVVAASFYTPEEALKLELFPPVRQHIEEHHAQTRT
jgi:ADP-ribose pyrophosphatase YjhB (NUDIX family)